MASEIKPDLVSPELFYNGRTIVDYHYLNTVRSQQSSSPEVVFADATLADRIRSILMIAAGNPITQDELLAIRTLVAVNSNITSLSGLEYAKRLLQIAVAGNAITDLSPLNGLPELAQIVADANEISDLSVLTNLPALYHLAVNYNNITDISPVNKLTALTILGADGNNISDISSLTSLVNMEQFSFVGNNISDISVVENYPNLKGVYFSGNPLSSIEPLRGRTNLQVAVLANIGISNFSVLADRAQLGRVEISGNNVTDISFMTKSKDFVQTFYAESNDITDLSPLTDAAKLKEIALYNNPNLSDITPLENAPVLALEVVPNTAVKDLTHVNKNITGLYIANNVIADFSPISEIKNLYELNAVNTGILDPSFINGLSILSRAYLDENQITDLRVFENPPILLLSVTDQFRELPAGVFGQPYHLSLFNPDGTVPEIRWLMPGSYDPVSETITWDTEGWNVLTWTDYRGSTYEFSGALVQNVVKQGN